MAEVAFVQEDAMCTALCVHFSVCYCIVLVSAATAQSQMSVRLAATRILGWRLL